MFPTMAPPLIVTMLSKKHAQLLSGQESDYRRVEDAIDRKEITAATQHADECMGRRQLGYASLTELLRKARIKEDDRNPANKIEKGGLPAWLFLLCLTAMGVTTICFSDWAITKDEADVMSEKMKPRVG